MSFVVYRSSAGSGKTSTLVGSYLKLALQSDYAFRHILAITFTNKAAGEMKERIISTLKLLSRERQSAEYDRYVGLFTTELKIDEAELNRRSRDTLKRILHAYSDFSVGTIDSFNHRIIRAFARDAGFSSAFDITLNTKELGEQAVDMLLSEYGQDEGLNAAIDGLLQEQMSGKKSFNVRPKLLAMVNEVFSENAKPFLEDIKGVDFKTIRECRQALYKEIQLSGQKIEAAAAVLSNLLSQMGIDPVELAGKSRGISVLLKRIQQKDFSYTPGIQITKTLTDGEWHNKTTDKNIISQIDAQRDALDAAGKTLHTVYSQETEKLSFLELLRKNLMFLGVVNRLRDWIDLICRDENKIPVSDFNLIISKLIAGEYAPYIYERTGNRYRDFLVDEFQDTSLLQWQNLLPLIENSLSMGRFSMLVGDGKQAIYRWRGGKVEQFTRLPEIFGRPANQHFEAIESLLKQQFDERRLDTNYRSKAEIVEFNNQFFDFVSERLGDEQKAVYREQKQNIISGKTGGYVGLDFIIKHKGETNPIIREKHIDRVLSVIKDLVGNGHKLKDITLLCRTGNEVKMVASALLGEGYGVISPDSLLIYNNIAVNFLISCIYGVAKADDRIAARSVVQFLKQHNKAVKPNINLPAEYAHMPLYELCEQLCDDYGLKNDYQPFINYFLDIVLDYQLKKNQGINAFLQYWEENKESFSVELPDGMNAISVMTIHKSKGLQFPIVIVPFADYDASPKADSRFWFKTGGEGCGNIKAIYAGIPSGTTHGYLQELKTQETLQNNLDMANVLYVALTRAENALFIISTITENTGEKKETTETPEPTKHMKAGNLLYDFASNCPTMTSSDAALFCSGSFPAGGDAVSTAPPLPSFGHFAGSTKWKQNIRIGLQGPKEGISASQRWGNLVHKAISMVFRKEDIPYALQSLLSSGEITAEEGDILMQYLLEVVGNESLSVFFHPENTIISERDFLTSSGKVLRPDRLAVSPNGEAWLTDFKTGHEEPSHAEQLRSYHNELKIMNINIVKSFLAYISDKVRIVEI